MQDTLFSVDPVDRRPVRTECERRIGSNIADRDEDLAALQRVDLQFGTRPVENGDRFANRAHEDDVGTECERVVDLDRDVRCQVDQRQPVRIAMTDDCGPERLRRRYGVRCLIELDLAGFLLLVEIDDNDRTVGLARQERVASRIVEACESRRAQEAHEQRCKQAHQFRPRYG